MLDLKTDSDPPLIDRYGALLRTSGEIRHSFGDHESGVAECQLPLIDLSYLRSGNEKKRRNCIEKIAEAASNWGFFQVLNHGISHKLLEDMRREQLKTFEMPFEKKLNCKLLNDSYRWGTPTANKVNEFSWSEAFHIPLSKISEEGCCYGEFNSLREVMEKFAAAMTELSRLLTAVLVENLNQPKRFFEENCNESTCFLRLNRYPPCSVSPEIFGLVPHTDSDFLTILYQDQVGGLQLMKDSRWVAVKPNPDALIVNIGDLFQAWSNNVYKSVEHKVMVNTKLERYSIAYFMCPSYDAMIESCRQPSLYKKFTFGQYRQQIQQDVKLLGHKVGLPRFLRQSK